MTSRVITEDEIVSFLNDLDCIFITQYMKDKFRRMIVFQDIHGYKFDVDYQNFIKNKKTGKINPSNPYSLENISLWLKLNNKSFRLHEDAIYYDSKTDLKFYCFDCEDDFYLSWNRINGGSTCPRCVESGGTYQIGKYNNLEYLNPELSSEWDYSKNNFLPNSVSPGSRKIVWWICNICEHSWEAKISNRACSNKRGCPNCAGKITTDKNRFVLLFPEIANEWSFDKNIGLNINNFPAYSNKPVWWECLICKHAWKSSIANRTNLKQDCPGCSGNVVTDKNRLIFRNPELIDEWDFEKNDSLNIANVSFGSALKAWWKCISCGYSWNSVIYSRSSHGRGCPRCSSSKGEKKIVQLLESFGLNIKTQVKFKDCKSVQSLPFDVGIISDDGSWILIEYMGIQHYKILNDEFFGGEKDLIERQNRDAIKTNWCKENNIPLITIPYWEYDNIENILSEELCLQ
jgi:hypothetical protein